MAALDPIRSVVFAVALLTAVAVHRSPVAHSAVFWQGSPSAGSPAPSPGPGEARLDLAAMALDAGDLPAEYHLIYETYVPGDRFAAAVLRSYGGRISTSEIAATGLRWFYDSVYSPPDVDRQIHSYLWEFPSPEAAVEAFALFEDETRTLGSGSVHADLPGPGVGEAPSETTIATIDAGGGQWPWLSVSATFRLGPVLAGVEIGAFSTPEPDRVLVAELAARLAHRVELVLAGADPPRTDLALPVLLVPLGATWRDEAEGYLVATEGLMPEIPAATAAFREWEACYGRWAAPGRDQGGAEPPEPPWVFVAVATFSSAAGAADLLGQTSSSSLETLPPVGGRKELVPAPSIAHATAVVAYRSASTPSGPWDGFAIELAVGERAALVAVIGAPGAEAAAVALATAQAACLARPGPCAVSVDLSAFEVP